MVTSAEIKKLKKGFYFTTPMNRKHRRKGKSSYGIQNLSKGRSMTVIGTTRYLTVLHPVLKYTTSGNPKYVYIPQTHQIK
jgi:hypothetical protein